MRPSPVTMEPALPQTPKNDKVLIIDDEVTRINLLTILLERVGYACVLGVADSSTAWSTFRDYKPDLVVLDLHMTPFTGFDVLRQIKPFIPAHDFVPILMLTGDVSREAREEALASGAMDFLSKPFSTSEIMLRMENLLKARRLHVALEEQKNELERRVDERTRELSLAYEEVYTKLVMMAEFRDDDTGEHAKRVARNAGAIAAGLGLDPSLCARIASAALLHDIGKIAIPDSILLKPGRLDAEEIQTMRKHVQIGAEILGNSHSEILRIAEQIALTHHEKWDGTGYRGLAGEEIPLFGRIVAVADVFDALTSERPYKDSWSVEAAIDEINAGSGTAFDPAVVASFNEVVGRASLRAAA